MLWIAGIDVHKRMLAVVVADVATEGDYEFERRQFGVSSDELRRLADWLITHKVQEVVMESAAQYWWPVWNKLERDWSAQCRSAEGAGPIQSWATWVKAGIRGRRTERLLKRLVAQELVLSFVPDAEQRVWRTVVRRKYQLTRDRVRLQNQLESPLKRRKSSCPAWCRTFSGSVRVGCSEHSPMAKQIQQPSLRLVIAGSTQAGAVA